MEGDDLRGSFLFLLKSSMKNSLFGISWVYSVFFFFWARSEVFLCRNPLPFLLCSDYCWPQDDLFLFMIFLVSAADSFFPFPNFSIAGASTPGALQTQLGRAHFVRPVASPNTKVWLPLFSG
jgi:hypothetical protein